MGNYSVSFNYMVEHNLALDSIFLSLADSTRRDMLRLLELYKSMSVGQIAIHYKMTFAGVSKHIKVLESAQLVRKKRKGKMQMVSINAKAFKQADLYIKQYERLWQKRFDRLEILLNEDK